MFCSLVVFLRDWTSWSIVESTYTASLTTPESSTSGLVPALPTATTHHGRDTGEGEGVGQWEEPGDLNRGPLLSHRFTARKQSKRKKAWERSAWPFFLEIRCQILVNRGWVSRKKMHPSTRPEGQMEGEMALTAIVRKTEKVLSLSPPSISLSLSHSLSRGCRLHRETMTPTITGTTRTSMACLKWQGLSLYWSMLMPVSSLYTTGLCYIIIYPLCSHYCPWRAYWWTDTSQPSQ